MTRSELFEVLARHDAQPPAGFEPKLLSCSDCGDRDDRLDLTAEKLPRWKVDEWLQKHAKCRAARETVRVNVVG